MPHIHQKYARSFLIICKLFGQYATPNETKLSNITGRFNSSIENKVLVVTNELQDIENQKQLNSDAMKSVITDKDIMYEAKYLNAREGENVANFLCFSNHDFSVKLESGDRRHVVNRCSEDHVGDEKYFNSLFASFKADGFYENLFTFFINRDIESWNPRQIPVTQLRTDLIEASKEIWEVFLDEYRESFYPNGDFKGFRSTELYSAFSKYCEDSGRKPYGKQGFQVRIKKYVDISGPKKDYQRKTVRYYYFNEAGKKRFPPWEEEPEEKPETITFAD